MKKYEREKILRIKKEIRDLITDSEGRYVGDKRVAFVHLRNVLRVKSDETKTNASLQWFTFTYKNVRGVISQSIEGHKIGKMRIGKVCDVLDEEGNIIKSNYGW